jgi:carotenoid cleavage dioxygenase
MVNWLNGELKNRFEKARGKPWTLGYASMNEDQLQSGPLKVEGDIPKDLRGTLYRNGPARHERGPGRYGHKWDGDGMVQAFSFRDGTVTHRGRYVCTKKFIQESAAGQFQFSAFGSSIAGQSELTTDIDDMNAANISVCVHDNELLALWEPGSAYSLDLNSLETLGPKRWRGSSPIRPFSAHPKLEPNGLLWNFGCDPVAGVLSVYAIAANGLIKSLRQFKIDALPPIHDFAVTRNHLVFVLSPLELRVDRLEAGHPFGASVAWVPGHPTRVLVVDKRSWALRWYEFPPAIFSHMGNAWEDAEGVIRFDCMCANDPHWMMHGWLLMRGEYEHVRGAVLTFVELKPDGLCRATTMASIEGEFPVVDPCMVGRRHREILCVTRGAMRSSAVPGWDSLSLIDVEQPRAQSYMFGDDWMVEEHVYAPNAVAPDLAAKWILGTALNLRTQKTVLSVFSADAISAGPLAQAELPYALPIGLHGTFHATR